MGISLNVFFFLQWFLSQNIAAFDDIKYESASLLAEVYEQQNQTNLAKPLLRKTIEMSQQNVFWHCRLLFQLAVIYIDILALKMIMMKLLVYFTANSFQ